MFLPTSEVPYAESEEWLLETRRIPRPSRFGSVGSCIATAALAIVVAFLGATPARAVTAPPGRAYEQVTPADKEDVDLRLQDPTMVSSSGGGIYFRAIGSFAGSPQNQLQNHYIAERGSAGWKTKPLDPPSLGSRPNTEAFAFTDDLSTALFSAKDPPVLAPGEPLDNFDLYLRDNERDSYSLVTGQTPVVPAEFDVPTVPWASRDLTHVLFNPEPGSKYFPGDHDDLWFYYVDAATGVVSSPGLIPDETTPDPDDEVFPPAVLPGAGTSVNANEWNRHAVSDDGSRIFFTTTDDADGNGLNASGPSQGAQLYVRKDHGTSEARTVRVSAPKPGAVDDSPGDTFSSWFRAASDDGSKVLFTSCERLTADSTAVSSTATAFWGGCIPADPAFFGPSKSDLYLFDVESGDLVDLTTSDPAGADVFGFVGASEDVSRAYFVARGNLAPGATGGEEKLYLWQQGEGITYIATVGGLVLVDPNNAFSRTRVTPDGGHLAFSSAAALEPGFDSAGKSQVYLYDAGEHELVCASCVGAGPATADATLANQGPFAGGVQSPRTGRIIQRNLVDDGSRVFFETADRLVDEDVNDVVDVYSYDHASGDVALISSGNSAFRSHFVNASPSGDDVFFKTRQRLVGWDQDDLVDIYDARVGGGFPEPPVVPDCGTDCQGEPAGRPSLADPASADLLGAGDLAPGRRASFSVLRLSRAARARLARGGRAVLRVRVSRAGKVSVSVRAKLAGRTRTVARASRRARGAGTVRLALRLSRAARRQLARRGRLTVSMSVRFAGVRETKRSRLTLKRAGRGRAGSEASARRAAGPAIGRGR